jgi:hypothetical protein
MITTLYAVSLAALLLLPVLLLFFLDLKMQQREHRLFLNYLAETAREKHLQFSGHEVLTGLAIGLDSASRKLVLVEKMHGHNYYSTIVNLNGMEACTTWKQYVIAGQQNNQSEKKQEGVKSILLLLHLVGKNTVEIPFYRSYENKAGERHALEKKAQHWEAILSKMIQQTTKRA